VIYYFGGVYYDCVDDLLSLYHKINDNKGTDMTSSELNKYKNIRLEKFYEIKDKLNGSIFKKHKI